MNNQLLLKFGQVVKDGRRIHGMEVWHLAERVSMSVDDIHQIERGVYDPKLSQMQALARVLDFQIADFL
ncbi:helix-turn-helix transcriptional regulator [bacterium]|nr:MAG: helix-turn-helix transcriptional regulator [bacterium]